MTPKGADLEATDLIEVSTIESGSYVTRSITGQELIDAIPLPPSGLTVGTTPISSGTNGRVLFQGTGNVLQQSIDFAFNTANSNLLLGRNASNTSALLFQYPRMAGINGVIWAETSASSPYGYIALDRGTGEMRMFTNTSYFPTFYSSNAERMRIATTGNVLINTTTDAGFRLDVNGTARINTLTVGLGGGQQSTNTAVGVTALNANTTGVSNTAIGFEALLLNSTASGNTALGRRALRATTGASNIAIGNGAMENNTSGVANIGIGEGAGNVNTTGGSNIFIGNWSSGVVNNGVNRTWIGNSSTTSTYLAGNVLINTTTDAGFRLDVNGTARFATSMDCPAWNWSGTNISQRIRVTQVGSVNRALVNIENGQGGLNYSTDGFVNSILAINNSLVLQNQGMASCFTINPTYNFNGNVTSGAIMRGIYYNPTLTNIGTATHYAFHSTSGRVRFENLPTSATGLSAGDIWNDGGTLKIV